MSVVFEHTNLSNPRLCLFCSRHQPQAPVVPVLLVPVLLKGAWPTMTVRLRSWELPADSPPVPADSLPEVDERAEGGSQASADASSAAAGSLPEVDERAEAGAQLAEVLIGMHISGRLQAKEVCVLSYWASKAGAVGPARLFARRPDSATGHFQRHLDRVAGLRGGPEQYLTISVPGHTKANASRELHEIQVLPPHEAVHQEIVQDPTILQSFNPHEWPASYHTHSVVIAARAAGAQPIPLAFYMDAAQYNKQGAAVVVFALCNQVSGARHLVAVLKKKEFCRRGCRGWCTLYPVFAFLQWSLSALGSGFFPVTRHDGTSWGDADPNRAAMAGLPLATRAAATQIKGDWAEYAHSLGFPTWRSSTNPCPWCRCDKGSMYSWEGGNQWEPLTQECYEEACARCEHHVVIATPELRDRVAALLFYDKRTLGSRGRTLRKPVPDLGLHRGDRLEPSHGCPDVAAFEQLPLPATVVFWRVASESVAKHRNPLLASATGLTIATLTVDTLHCLYLGALQVHCSRVIWGMVQGDFWRTAADGHTTAPARLQESCTRLQAAITAWCRVRARTRPGDGLTEVQELTPYHLGASPEEQKLGLKGGETKTMLLFLHDLLEKGADNVANSNHMLKASRALVRHLALLKESPRIFSNTQEKDPTMTRVTST